MAGLSATKACAGRVRLESELSLLACLCKTPVPGATLRLTLPQPIAANRGPLRRSALVGGRPAPRAEEARMTTQALRAIAQATA